MKSKWLTKSSKESEFNCSMKAKFFRLVPLFAVVGLLAFISILHVEVNVPGIRKQWSDPCRQLFHL